MTAQEACCDCGGGQTPTPDAPTPPTTTTPAPTTPKPVAPTTPKPIAPTPPPTTTTTPAPPSGTLSCGKTTSDLGVTGLVVGLPGHGQLTPNGYGALAKCVSGYTASGLILCKSGVWNNGFAKCTKSGGGGAVPIPPTTTTTTPKPTPPAPPAPPGTQKTYCGRTTTNLGVRGLRVGLPYRYSTTPNGYGTRVYCDRGYAASGSLVCRNGKWDTSQARCTSSWFGVAANMDAITASPVTDSPTMTLQQGCALPTQSTKCSSCVNSAAAGGNWVWCAYRADNGEVQSNCVQESDCKSNVDFLCASSEPQCTAETSNVAAADPPSSPGAEGADTTSSGVGNILGDLGLPVAVGLGAALVAVMAAMAVVFRRQQLRLRSAGNQQVTATTSARKTSTSDGAPVMHTMPEKMTKSKSKSNKAPRFVETLYEYKAATPDELSFYKGERIEVLEEENSAGWCKGRLAGKTGLFPGNYVR